MDDFILHHRQRLTREAITARLVEAGHDRAEIDAAWERLTREQPLAGPSKHNLSTYVWIVYWLGAGLIAAFIVAVGLGGVVAYLYVAWLLVYLGLAYLPARALARGRPSSILGAVATVVAAPLIVVAIGGVTCFATLTLLIRSMGY